MTTLTAWLAFPAALFVGSLLFVAAITARESLRPRPTLPIAAPVAVESTSSTPIYEALAVELFDRELDQQIADGLRDWGRGDVA